MYRTYTTFFRTPNGYVSKLLLVMKLTAFILLISLLQVSAASFGQRVTLKQNNISIDRVFREIQKQTGVDIVFEKSNFDQSKKINISFQDATLDVVMNKILTGTEMVYTIEDNTIVLKTKEKSIAEKIIDYLVNIDVTGKVVDENGSPIAGANVVVKASGKGVSTNADGSFKLSNLKEGELLVITYMGYEPKEVTAKNHIGIIQLIQTNNPLDEVQVVAFGITTKRLSTGNVSMVTAKDIEKQPVTNPIAALYGRTPGVVINQTSGVSGSGFFVQIRGRNSINSGNNPLYVIDGVPYADESSNLGSSALTSRNALSFIDPLSIETISVLKDADATAIYGSRGGNGVVLITTKKGKAGAAKISFDTYAGLSVAGRSKIELLNTQQWMEVRREAFKNDGLVPNASAYSINGAWDTTRYTNWREEFIKNYSHDHRINASISGGSANVQYVFQSGFQKNGTVFPGDFSDKRASFHTNISTNSSDNKFKLSLTADYLHNLNTTPGRDITSLSMLPPNAPALFNADGSLNWQNNTWVNPLGNIFRQFSARTNNFYANSVVSYEFVKGLSLKGTFAYRNTGTKSNAQTPIKALNPANETSGSSNFLNGEVGSWQIDPNLSYKNSFQKHNLNIITGTTFLKNFKDDTAISAAGYANDLLLGSLTGAATYTINALPEFKSTYKYNALYTRLNYGYDDKILLNLSFTRDGSSRFGPGRQFQNFWSIGTGYIFTKERFFTDHVHFLSFGKIRGSYGTSGNDQIGDYKFLNTYRYLTGMNPYQGTQGLVPEGLFNPDFSWEINKKAEIGLELGFVKDRITTEFSYFRNRSSNQLVPYSLPYVTGFPNVNQNQAALVQNAGLEFVLNAQVVNKNGLTWNTSFNISRTNNKLLDYPNLATSTLSTVFILGQPLDIQQRYRMLGVDPQTGLYTFQDRFGNPTFAPSINDRTELFTLTPRFFGGFINSFSYKRISLELVAQFSRGNIPDYMTFRGVPGQGEDYNLPVRMLDRWQKPGDISRYQRYTSSTSSAAYTAFSYAEQSDFAVIDSWLVRLKNVSLSYSLPENWIKAIKFNKLDIYFQAQNLFTFTNVPELDPEIQVSTTLSPLRVLTFGLRASL